MKNGALSHTDIVARLPRWLTELIENEAIEEPIILGLMEHGLTNEEIGLVLQAADRPHEPQDLDIDAVIGCIRKKWQDKAQEGDADTAGIKAWPFMESKAMYGIVGKIARLATKNSEADPVAVAATTLAYAAAEFGRAQYTNIGDDIHHSRHFKAIVGRSSRARKGTSYGPVQRIFKRAEAIRLRESTLSFPSGCRLKVSGGPLSSGEGLVYAIRDASSEGEDDGSDAGVADKRLLVVEQELGAAFRAFQRTGNTLSMTLRRAFDGETLEPLTKNNRIVATEPHINIVGHITRHELSNLLTGTEIWNGFGNRFQWLMARRQKTVPFPEPCRTTRWRRSPRSWRGSSS